MIESIVLMICDDSLLIEWVGKVVDSVEGLTLAVLPGIDSTHSYDSWDRVGLVVIHLHQSAPDAALVRLLRMASGARRPPATLVVADRLDVSQRLALLQLGVSEYVVRPLDLARLSHLVNVLTLPAREAGGGGADIPATLGSSGEDDDPIMERIRRVAAQDATILLGGETGTGKTRLARQIHELSNRRAEPFVVVNCGSVTPHQLESEMFGQARGSLEGSRKDRAGQFAEVGRGTLFLDQIDALPLSLQPRLLRVVEDRAYETGGASKAVPIRARLIAATNRDLEAEIEAGLFRSDLYYRLNVIGLNLPPLRERRALIPMLASKFIREAPRAGHGVAVDSISEDALRLLEEYQWPGNIRELRNTIERAVALSSGPEIQPEDLPEALTRRDLSEIRRGYILPSHAMALSGPNSTLAEIKRDAELARITEALEKHSNNRLRAASELGISRMTLYKKLYKYGLMNQNPASRRARN